MARSTAPEAQAVAFAPPPDREADIGRLRQRPEAGERMGDPRARAIAPMLATLAPRLHREAETSRQKRLT